MQTSTNGGRNDTEQKALAVMPCTSPLAVSTVMTVTPVAKRPRADRNSSAVTKSGMKCSRRKLYPEANIPDLSTTLEISVAGLNARKSLQVGAGAGFAITLRTSGAGRANRPRARGRVEEFLVAINFTGEFTTPRSPDEVFEFLSDPNKFGPLFPDFESMTLQDPTHFTMKLAVEVGNIRGIAEIKMELAEALRPRRALYKGTGTAAGGQIAIGAGFELSPLEEGTRVAWQGEASVFGKLAKLTGGMLEPIIKKNIQKLIDGLRWALYVPSPGTVAEGTDSVQVAPAEEI